jgi:hypothetical protein
MKTHCKTGFIISNETVKCHVRFFSIKKLGLIHHTFNHIPLKLNIQKYKIKEKPLSLKVAHQSGEAVGDAD